MIRALFFDRDNTLTLDHGFTFKVEDLVLLPWAHDIISYAKSQSLLIFLITNQSGIGRGMYGLAQAEEFNKALEVTLGIQFDGIGICPHLESDICTCRKPATWLVTPFMQEYSLTPDECIFIGDKEIDVECGLALGMRTARITRADTLTNAHFQIASIAELTSLLE